MKISNSEAEFRSRLLRIWVFFSGLLLYLLRFSCKSLKMEVSVIQSSQAKALALPTELGHRELGLCSYKAYGFRSLYSRANLSFSRKWRPARLRVAPPMAVLSDPVRSNEVCRLSEGSKSVSVCCLASEKFWRETEGGEMNFFSFVSFWCLNFWSLLFLLFCGI